MYKFNITQNKFIIISSFKYKIIASHNSKILKSNISNYFILIDNEIKLILY